MSQDRRIRNDQAMFDAYVSLRKIAQNYNLEDKLNVPRVVFVGETSSGKSMLVQNFLRFPCAFSQSDVGTRCPVLYRLRYNPNLSDGEILIKHPEGVRRHEDLATHLHDVMKQIEDKDRFRLEEYLVHIESNRYRDFEILDVPGLICGAKDNENIAAVEKITEHYVRDPRFLIVQLKDSTQIAVNSAATKRIQDFCLLDPAPRGSTLPPRTDVENHTITIQTKFDLFMEKHRDASDVNENLRKLDEHFNHRTFFVSMIFKGYNFDKKSFEENMKYIDNLPGLEKTHVDEWIELMKRPNHPSSYNSEEFDEQRFRPLIGINVVRDHIQNMWVEEFRSAIPKIHQVLRQLVQENQLRYDALVKIVEEKDVNMIRDLYTHFFKQFRSTLSKYASFRAEIYNLFDYNTYGRSYPQIEDEFNQWSRRHEFEWPAHQTAEQMLHAPAEQRLRNLTEEYIGVRHFERLRQVLYYMILQYNPTPCSKGWIESAQGVLYGIIADNENLEKGAREALYTHISETFQMGMAWLTHIYSFLLEHFEQHVSEVLLNPTGQFASLAVGHDKFLSYVRLDYHQKTRQMIRRAIEACRMTRDARMQYVSHGIRHFLRVLSESLPPKISNQDTTAKVLPKTNLKTVIFNPGNFLTAERDSESASYLPSVKNTTDEIFVVVRGLLLQDISMFFNANVVCAIQRYDTEDIGTDLPREIDQMSSDEIARISHIDYERHSEELNLIYQTLSDLRQASDEIDYASRLFDDKTLVDFQFQQGKGITAAEKSRNQQHQTILKKLGSSRSNKSESELTDERSTNEPQDTDEYQLKMLSNDAESCQQFLLQLFKKHDLEDLRANFLEREDFPKRKHNKNRIKPVNRAPETSNSSLK